MTLRNESAFSTLYPDVDPHEGLPLSGTERLALAVAFAVMAYGAVVGDIIVAAVGLVLALAACIIEATKTNRRIRAQARSRFPGEDWVEYRTARRLNLGLLLPLFIAVIGVLIAAGFWFIPPEHDVLGGIIIALLVAALVWFMPGLNPIWSKLGKKKEPADQYAAPADAPAATPASASPCSATASTPQAQPTAPTQPTTLNKHVYHQQAPASDDTSVIPTVDDKH
ncbi:hypothetical protein [Corynebacterium confusum]|uniref:hypothetical protein n=1 Tax=Corynebacterium confusum TaxID=71254 RepID=UPI0025B435F8|nr:hypothetical protein [Corynebacterium confusum]WJY88844.1 hypothetical protein CCONF_01405 [Corynebacterium confusum]